VRVHLIVVRLIDMFDRQVDVRGDHEDGRFWAGGGASDLGKREATSSGFEYSTPGFVYVCDQ
jgi:hypothetical protein